MNADKANEDTGMAPTTNSVSTFDEATAKKWHLSAAIGVASAIIGVTRLILRGARQFEFIP
jgi:hypothetical protein